MNWIEAILNEFKNFYSGIPLWLLIVSVVFACLLGFVMMRILTGRCGFYD